uniref:Bm9001 n=1 Tax=Brugia malayi TaxID=6279 RepID=A0A0H5S332_BRUMA|nr:Bm9001 [Brugia malayi]
MSISDTVIAVSEIGTEYHYNQYIVLGFGSSPAALMKSGCTITTLIAIDRIWALWTPMKYYAMNKKPLLCGGFIFSLLMAGFDFSLIFILSNGFKPTSTCSAFACFTSEASRASFYVIIVSAVFGVVPGGINGCAQRIQSNASRASFYVIIVSAVFGVVPGGINGCAQRIQSNFIKTLAFYIQLCASISGLSHAFIFGMAHSLIRRRIFVMLKLNKYCTEQAPRFSQNSVFPMTNLN